MKRAFQPQRSEGGFNRVETRLQAGVPVVDRVPRRPAEDPLLRALGVQEARVSQRMHSIGVAPAVFDADVGRRGALASTSAWHGQDLHSVVSTGRLLGRRLPANDVLNFVADLRRKVARCADAGVAHLDFKPANVVLLRRHQGHLDARLIDWDPRFLATVRGDAALLKSLKAVVLGAELACDALRCAYTVVMWGLMTLHLRDDLRRRGARGELQQFLSAFQTTLRQCSLPDAVVDAVLRSGGALVSGVRHYARSYLHLESALEVFQELRRLGLRSSESAAGTAFGVDYSAPGASAAEQDGRRRVHGDFAECRGPTRAAVVAALEQATTSWDDDFAPGEFDRPTELQSERADYALDLHQQRQRDLDRERKARRRAKTDGAPSR